VNTEARPFFRVLSSSVEIPTISVAGASARSNARIADMEDIEGAEGPPDYFGAASG
jgi:hypothetical protein